jgi:Tol biopolymer transport system component
VLFDITTQTRTTPTENNVNYPTWTADGKYLYFDTVTGKEPAIMRVAVPGGKLERVASLKEMRRPTGALGLWSGLAPDGSPLTIRYIGTQEIYAFEVRFP